MIAEIYIGLLFFVLMIVIIWIGIISDSLEGIEHRASNLKRVQERMMDSLKKKGIMSLDRIRN